MSIADHFASLVTHGLHELHDPNARICTNSGKEVVGEMHDVITGIAGKRSNYK